MISIGEAGMSVLGHFPNRYSVSYPIASTSSFAVDWHRGNENQNTTEVHNETITVTVAASLEQTGRI